MEIILSSIRFFFAILLTGLMGFSIQRGATCTVVAITEIVNNGRYTRLLSMIEAALWVLGGLLLANAFHNAMLMPAGYSIQLLTVLGGILLGLGAYVNQACVFGAVAKLGSGEWAYISTPVGFFIGCKIFFLSFHQYHPINKLPYSSFVLSAPSTVALLFLIWMAFTIIKPIFLYKKHGERQFFSRKFHQALVSHVWSPRAATIIIGISFIFLLYLLGGTWAYTEVLSDIANSTFTNLTARTILFISLFAGALLGGWTAGKFSFHHVISIRKVLICLIGGMMMGLGSAMIPGGNDGLLLIGMPLLWPYAWLAFMTMCITIAITLKLDKSKFFN